MKNEIKHLPRTWCKLKNVKVHDADGWRSSAGKYGHGPKNWNTPITEEEFLFRMRTSTCSGAGLTDLFRLPANQKFQDALAVLSEAYKRDPGAIHALICNRVPCNKDLADHPTVQVELNEVTFTPTYAVGMLGVLNGVLEVLTGEKVSVRFGKPDLCGQCKVTGFERYDPRKEKQISVVGGGTV